MRNRVINLAFLLLLFFTTISCATNKQSYEDLKAKVYSNDFKFIVTKYDSRKTFSAPAGTGRILSSNLPVSASEEIGVIVNHKKLVVNLPLDENTSTLKKSRLEFTSYDFTVARKDLDNGNILINFFLNDQKEINLIKMEVNKNNIIDASIEGPKQLPLLYLGEIRLND